MAGGAKGRKIPRTPAVVQQRREAGTVHGAYGIRDSGPQTVSQQSRYAELMEQLKDREGVVNIMIDQAANIVLMTEVARSYIAKRARDGVDLGEIALLRALPAMYNTAGRALSRLLDEFDRNGEEPVDLLEYLKGGASDGESD